ncbi:MAG: alpha/beta fold hydrolase [Planctomycetota bacterium]
MFASPEYRPSNVYVGGHLQTLATLRPKRLPALNPRRHVIKLSDHDAVVLHEDQPRLDTIGSRSLPASSKRVEDTAPAVLLVHGLCGCHAAAYMIRMADRLTRCGLRVFRMDMRGCGSALDLAANVTHAGRSADCLAAMDFIADRTSGPLAVAGFSMGGNQVLRMVGRLELDRDPADGNRGDPPEWKSRLVAAAAVSPPVDLARCSRFMLEGVRRLYSRYFLKQLLRRIPSRVAARAEVQAILRDHRPTTLWDLDDRLTAPLSGFKDANDYYDDSSAMHVTEKIAVPTFILAAKDDPIVPASCFAGPNAVRFSKRVHVQMVDRGGHLGYVDRSGDCWMDEVLQAYLVVQTGVGSISSANGLP